MATKPKAADTTAPQDDFKAPETVVENANTQPPADPIPVVVVADPNTPLTPGQRACGVAFNPGGDPRVDRIKREFATCVDTLLNLRDSLHDGEVQRMLSIAITEAQTAQMWAVKAVTWRG